MTIQRVQPGPRMSQAVVHGDTVYLAGQVAEGASVAEQSRAALAQVDELLAGVGSDRSKLLNVTIYLADIGSFAEMNSVWDTWVDGANPPARATVEAKLATPDFLVEFAVVAAR
ncbi:Enamine deaminase RidA, house cleaning of reactive enamine intermediates, YjgF/YER057c/UK114 family [Agromyces sp. CF514]|uniref:RidA family protein n=1 Tax=Agromyces sp. CF514 TaxID=1881031 RepID=UPI0008E4CF0B|nr:RidA family protein [Agromyces sp. CF514]SFR70282.1 Enamine deaminase RidA, house cleaning of reactive enamine intermediates, YjgF/YER057c/UK114 family [Agromyces sp. CF514]